MNKNLIVSDFKTQIEMAEKLARSNLLQSHLRGKPNDVYVILQVACELNIPPMQALMGINVINSKATVSPQLMLGLIYRDHPEAYINVKTEGEGDKIQVSCEMARKKGEEPFVSVWDIEKAKKMNLIHKDNYKKQPETMLRWRAVSEAARIVFPDTIQGIYTHEEFDDKDENIYDEDMNIVGKKKDLKKDQVVEVKKQENPLSVLDQIKNQVNYFIKNKMLPEKILERINECISKDFEPVEFKNLEDFYNCNNQDYFNYVLHLISNKAESKVD